VRLAIRSTQGVCNAMIIIQVLACPPSCGTNLAHKKMKNRAVKKALPRMSERRRGDGTRMTEKVRGNEGEREGKEGRRVDPARERVRMKTMQDDDKKRAK